MKAAHLLIALVVLANQPAFHAFEQTASSLAPKPTVYVSDFDLDVVPGKFNPPPANQANQAAGKKEEDPKKLASHLVDLVSTSLVVALREAGYSAQRLPRDQGRPSGGMQIRGIFAEVDKENHWRRAVIRSGSDTGKMQLLVSVANLARPEQALYEIAPLPGNENKPGAVITLSPYVPLEKFEINKDSGDDLIKKTASRVVADLSALLNANPAAVPQ